MEHPLLWQPEKERVVSTRLWGFYQSVQDQVPGGIPADPVEAYKAVYRWSLDYPEQFWHATAVYTEQAFATMDSVVVQDIHKMPGARWFPDTRVNACRQLLSKKQVGDRIVFRNERGDRRTLNDTELHDAVANAASWLRTRGIAKGDRVAACMPNLPETVIMMLATTSIGAIWTSTSPDFGEQGVLDRFVQTEPKVLLSCDGYFYNGKVHDIRPKIARIVAQLPTVEAVVITPYAEETPNLDAIPKAVPWAEIMDQGSTEIVYEELPFDHPMYIMYSSGTTGVPKCIVHGTGGTLLQHAKEHILHNDVQPGDVLFYFTTCGWMMWNWLVSGLQAGACLLLYDGSPFYPDGWSMFQMAHEENVAHFGTGAKFLAAAEKAGVLPIERWDFPALRTIMSTGSPLTDESFAYVYTSVKPDVCLSSISGGTDILSCFALGNPTLPVYRGELQCRGLGMAVEAWDDAGKPVYETKGELVCTKAFPSMPVGFWNDPDGTKYYKAYFDTYAGVWHHGDFIEITQHDGVIVYGRSDATLNPGGVRIGTAEIYRQVETIDEVLDSIVVGRPVNGDVDVVLFVKLRPGIKLDESLVQKIRETIRANTTPRHVPRTVAQVPDIPYTLSGKKVEIAVRRTILGESVPNKDALANPDSLEAYKDHPALR